LEISAAIKCPVGCDGGSCNEHTGWCLNSCIPGRMGPFVHFVVHMVITEATVPRHVYWIVFRAFRPLIAYNAMLDTTVTLVLNVLDIVLSALKVHCALSVT